MFNQIKQNNNISQTDVQTQRLGGNVQQGQNGQPNRGNCLADDCLLVEDLEYPAGELTETVQVALDGAINAIYDKYGLTVPANTWGSKVSAPETLKEACQVGVEAEIANAELYRKELIPAVSGYEDISAVFENLMSASEDKHLPAFEKCN